MSIEKLEEYIAAGDLAGVNDVLMQDPSLATTNTSANVSPLMLSCYYKKPAITELLLKHVSEINLFEAAAAGKFDVAAHILYSHADTVNVHAPDGFSPLGLA